MRHHSTKRYYMHTTGIFKPLKTSIVRSSACEQYCSHALLHMCSNYYFSFGGGGGVFKAHQESIAAATPSLGPTHDFSLPPPPPHPRPWARTNVVLAALSLLRGRGVGVIERWGAGARFVNTPPMSSRRTERTPLKNNHSSYDGSSLKRSGLKRSGDLDSLGREPKWSFACMF